MVRETPAGSLLARRVQSSRQFQFSRRGHTPEPGDIRAVARRFADQVVRQLTA